MVQCGGSGAHAQLIFLGAARTTSSTAMATFVAAVIIAILSSVESAPAAHTRNPPGEHLTTTQSQACTRIPLTGIVLAAGETSVVVCPGVYQVDTAIAKDGAAISLATVSNVTITLTGVSVAPAPALNGSMTFDGWGVRAQGCNGLQGG